MLFTTLSPRPARRPGGRRHADVGACPALTRTVDVTAHGERTAGGAGEVDGTHGLPAAGERARGTARSVDRDEGSSAVELAILTPIAFMLVLLVAQFALFIHARQVVTAAAQQGVRNERLSTVGGGQGQSTALAFAQRLGGKAVTGVSAQVDRSRDTVTVTVAGQGQSILPWMHLTVTGTSSGPVEQWTGDIR